MNRMLCCMKNKKAKLSFVIGLCLLLVSALPCAGSKVLTAQELLNRGREMEQSHYRDAALADYSKAIELEANFAPAYHARGRLKLRKGDLDGAIADFTKAIESDPKYFAVYYDRGLIKKATGDWDGAISDFSQVIDLYPKSANHFFLALVLNNRGDVKKTKGDLDGAIADFAQLIALFPNTREAFYANLQSLRDYANGLKGRCGSSPDFERLARFQPSLIDDLEQFLWHSDDRQGNNPDYWKQMNQRLIEQTASLQKLEESLNQAELKRSKLPPPPTPHR